MKFLLIQNGDAPEEATVTVCETRAERMKETQRAIFGTDDLTSDEWSEYIKIETSLAETGIVSFEADPAIRWMDVANVEFKALYDRGWKDGTNCLGGLV